MKDIFSAMFEGALLSQAGVPVREMYTHVADAYSDAPDVTQLFADLKKDWDEADPIQEYKMVGPFKKREATRPDFLIASTFAEIAAITSMVEGFWRNCALTYILKNHVMHTTPKSNDLKLARELFGFIPEDHAMIHYLFSVAPGTEWNMKKFYASQAEISFEDWVKATWPKMSPPMPFRCRKAAENACVAAANLELLPQLQTEWDRFSSLLGD